MKLLISLLVLCLTQVLFPQLPRIEYEEYRLDNGLRVILHRDNTNPIVAITVTYHTGSKNEHPERTGFAHFFEHLMFEGTPNIPRGKFMEIVQNAGGQLNASTSFDQTFYYLLFPSNRLEFGLYLESERLLQLKIDSLGVETQRNVVKEERRQRYDNTPYGSMMEKLFAKAYTVHPYRWMPIGSIQYIDKAGIEEFIDFYQHYYVPGNAILSIAGDITIDETKALIEKYFGEIPVGNQTISRPTEIEPQQLTERRDTVYDNIKLPALIMGYHIPERTHKDMPALTILGQVLSSGQSSRLYTRLVDETRAALSVSASPLQLEHPGLFLVSGYANSGVALDSVELLIEAEFDKIKNDLITDWEYEKSLNSMENRFVSSRGTMMSIASSLASNALYFNDPEMINSGFALYQQVTKEDVKEVANKYLKRENRTILYYLPKNQEGGKK